jgi:NADH-quinone oxidoreductase subunit N
MLALMGFPIFGGAGFYAKWYVLQAALQAPVRQTTLAVVLVLTTVISAGYYLYVLVRMFMRPRSDAYPVPEKSGGLTQAVLALNVALILILGVVPEGAIAAARLGRPRMDVEPVTTRIPGPVSVVTPPDSAQRLAEGDAAQPTR